MRDGINTSEFWVTVVAMGILGTLGFFDRLTPELIAAIGGPTVAYNLARGIAKHGNGAT